LPAQSDLPMPGMPLGTPRFYHPMGGEYLEEPGIWPENEDRCHDQSVQGVEEWTLFSTTG
jgi:hypothetical protein